MKKQTFIVIILIAVTALYAFVFMPYLSRKTAVNVANQILMQWKNENQTKVFDLWVDPESAPPIYGIKSYNIVNTHFYKEKKVHKVDIEVEIGLGNSNFLKDIKTWVLTLERTRHGWLAKYLRPKN